MPRIPTAGTSTQRARLVPLSSPGRTVALGGALANVFDQATGLALGVNAKLEDAKRKDEFISFSSEFNRVLSENQLESEDPEAFKNGMDAELSSRLERIDDPELVQALRARHVFAIDSSLAIVRARVSKKQRGEARDHFIKTRVPESIEGVAAARLSGPSGSLEAERRTSEFFEDLELTEHLTPQEKLDIPQMWRMSVEREMIATLVNEADEAATEPQAVASLDQALAILKDPDSELNPEDRKKLRRGIEAERSVVVSKFNMGAALELKRTIDDAVTADDFETATNEIDFLLKKGAISEGRAISMDNRLQARGQRLDSADTGARMVEMARRFNIPIDPSDRDSVDAYYEDIFLPDLAGKTEAEVTQATVEMIGEINILPRSVESHLAAVANSDNPEMIERAAQLFVDIRNASPQAVERISDATSIFLENVSEAVKINVPVEESVKIARETAKLNPNEIKGRSQEHSFEQGMQTDGEWLISNSDEFRLESPKLFTFDVSSDEVDSALRGMFSAEVKRQFILDPNIDKARERALKKLALVYGTTQVGGTVRNMYLAPELMYPGFQDDSDKITKQLVDDVFGINDQVEGITKRQLSDRLLLAADTDSAREFDADTGVLTPGYNVFLRNDEDGSTTIILGEDNLPIRFFPEDGSEIRKVQAEKLLGVKEERSRGQAVLSSQRLLRKQQRAGDELTELGQGAFVPSDELGSVFGGRTPTESNRPGFIQ